MIDKTLEITAFLKEHYKPSNLQDAKPELQLTTQGILKLLFTIFPHGCIDDYDLHNILTNIGYIPQKRSITEFVWCLEEV